MVCKVFSNFTEDTNNYWYHFFFLLPRSLNSHLEILIFRDLLYFVFLYSAIPWYYHLYNPYPLFSNNYQIGRIVGSMSVSLYLAVSQNHTSSFSNTLSICDSINFYIWVDYIFCTSFIVSYLLLSCAFLVFIVINEVFNWFGSSIHNLHLLFIVVFVNFCFNSIQV